MSRLEDLLADPASEKRFIAEMTVYDPAANRVGVVVVSTHGFVSQPTDPIPNTIYGPRIKQVPTYQRSLFSPQKLSGRSSSSDTQIVLANDDGAYDNFYNLAWAGRICRLYIGGEGFSRAEYGLLMAFVMREPVFGDNTITIPLRDVSIFGENEYQQNKYAGTGGAEGTADLAGRLKPDAIGCCRKVPPVYLGLDGSGRHLFGVGSRRIVGVLGVWDRGSPLAYASNSPQPGEYAVDLNTATITLGGAFVGPIQVDVLGRSYLRATSPSAVAIGLGAKSFAVSSGGGAPEAQIANGMRVRCQSNSDPAGTWMDGYVTTPRPGGTLNVIVDSFRGSGTASSWTICPWGTASGLLFTVGASVGLLPFLTVGDQFNDIQPATCGIWLPQGGRGIEIIDAIADGTGSFWNTNRSNIIEVGRLDEAVTPDVEFDQTQIISIERISTDEPIYQYTLRYRRNWSPLSPDQISGVAANNATQFTEEWKSVTVASQTVKGIYQTSQDIQLDTLFDEVQDAADEAVRQFELFGRRRDYFKITQKWQAAGLPINASIKISHPRYGLNGGRTLRMVDLNDDYDQGLCEMGLWG